MGGSPPPGPTEERAEGFGASQREGQPAPQGGSLPRTNMAHAPGYVVKEIDYWARGGLAVQRPGEGPRPGKARSARGRVGHGLRERGAWTGVLSAWPE